MKQQHFISILLILSFLSCENVRPYHRKVENYFETWVGEWEIDQVTYIDKNVDIPFTDNKPFFTFYPCPKVTQNEGGMCDLTLTDQNEEVNNFYAIGSAADTDQQVDEDNIYGSLRIEFNPHAGISSNFNDSLLITGEFICKRFSDDTAILEGGWIIDLTTGASSLAENLRITLSRR